MSQSDAGDAVEMCACGRGVLEHFLTRLPKPQGAYAVGDDLFGEASTGAGDDGHDASSMSECEGEDEQPKGPPAETPDPLLASPQGRWSMSRVRTTRQGMSSQAWGQVVDMMSPSMVILAAPITSQAGLIKAVMSHNDARYGLGTCPLIGFCVELPPSPAVVSWSNKHVKWWQVAHLSLHTLDSALHGYCVARHKAMTSNQGLLVHQRPTLVKRRLVLRHSSGVGSANALGNPESALASPQGKSSAVAKVSRLIQIPGNLGKDKTHLSSQWRGRPGGLR